MSHSGEIKINVNYITVT